MMTVLVIGRVCLEGKEILVCKVSLVYVDHQDYLVNLGWVKELRVILETEYVHVSINLCVILKSAGCF
jgi:hypothetical protein